MPVIVEKSRKGKNMNQEKKRVLMFCVHFFEYEKRIADAMRNQGYEVDLYDERPSEGFVGKACVRYNVKAYRPIIKRHIKNIIRDNRDKKYDYILVVKGEALYCKAIDMLREAYPDAELILYLWDSVANIPECEKRMKRYDRVLTFDPQDAKKYDIRFLSIPYDETSFAYEQTDAYQYDVAFIGTAHSVRPRVVKQVEAICAQQNRTCYSYFYSPHILVYLLNKLTNPNYKWITLKDIHFKPLSPQQVYEIYQRSRCVLDIEHPKQQGSTTRPVEMLPMKKKIITTNRNMTDYPFYNNHNFCVIDRDNPQIDEMFWQLPYVSVDDDVLEGYSPKQFVCAIFSEV